SETDGTFPFEFRFATPVISVAKTNFTMRAKATDTGGNSSWTDAITVTLLPDTTPPKVVQVRPVGGGKKVDTIARFLHETIDPATLNQSTLRLSGAGPDGITGTADDVPVVGGMVSFRPEVNAAELSFLTPLADGLYRVVLAPSISDLFGNSLGAEFAWRLHI